MTATYKVTVYAFRTEADRLIADIKAAAASCGLQARLLKRKSYTATVSSVSTMGSVTLYRVKLKFEISGANDTIVNAFSAGLARHP